MNSSTPPGEIISIWMNGGTGWGVGDYLHLDEWRNWLGSGRLSPSGWMEELAGEWEIVSMWMNGGTGWGVGDCLHLDEWRNWLGSGRLSPCGWMEELAGVWEIISIWMNGGTGWGVGDYLHLDEWRNWLGSGRLSPSGWMEELAGEWEIISSRGQYQRHCSLENVGKQSVTFQVTVHPKCMRVTSNVTDCLPQFLSRPSHFLITGDFDDGLAAGSMYMFKTVSVITNHEKLHGKINNNYAIY